MSEPIDFVAAEEVNDALRWRDRHITKLEDVVRAAMEMRRAVECRWSEHPPTTNGACQCGVCGQARAFDAAMARLEGKP